MTECEHGRWIVMGDEGVMLYAHCAYDCGLEVRAKTKLALKKKLHAYAPRTDFWKELES